MNSTDIENRKSKDLQEMLNEKNIYARSFKYDLESVPSTELKLDSEKIPSGENSQRCK